MKFLIVEDNAYKAKQLIECLEGHEFEIVGSYNYAMRKLVQESFDAVFLDMGFPKFEGDIRTLKKDQGLAVLFEMKWRKIELPVMVYSSNTFDTSDYPFVLDYLVDNNTYIDDRVTRFIEKATNFKKVS